MNVNRPRTTGRWSFAFRTHINTVAPDADGGLGGTWMLNGHQLRNARIHHITAPKVRDEEAARYFDKPKVGGAFRISGTACR
jgi:hypothetical protein